MRYFIIGLSFVFVIACNSSKEKLVVPEVDEIELEVGVIRYAQAMMDIDTNNVRSELEALIQKYPTFSDLYFKQLTGLHVENQDSFYQNVTYFLKDDRINKLKDLIREEFDDFSDIEKDLKKACQYLRYYFPEIPTPAFYTLFSEFAFQSFIFSVNDRDAIGIGLDMYLGDGFDYKNVDPTNPAFSQYLARTYNKDHIVKKSMDILIEDILGSANGKRFIDQIIQKGKKIYIARHIMPEEPDTIIFEYSKDQWQWLQENELQIWSFFLEKNLLYETNHLKINKYVNNSPTSQGMPPESPGRTGPYIGYQIVKAFMNRKPELNLKDLVLFNDSQKLMEISKYKPNRR